MLSHLSLSQKTFVPSRTRLLASDSLYLWSLLWYLSRVRVFYKTGLAWESFEADRASASEQRGWRAHPWLAITPWKAISVTQGWRKRGLWKMSKLVYKVHCMTKKHFSPGLRTKFQNLSSTSCNRDNHKILRCEQPLITGSSSNASWC